MGQASFGFKMVDRGYAQVRPLLDLALAEGRPVEVGLYFAEAETLTYYDGFFPASGLALNTHLDHRVINLYKAPQQQDLLRRQIEQSMAWGAGYAVDHLALYPFSKPRAYRERVMDRLFEQLVITDALITEYGFPIYIENTFDDMDFFHEFVCV